MKIIIFIFFCLIAGCSTPELKTSQLKTDGVVEIRREVAQEKSFFNFFKKPEGAPSVEELTSMANDPNLAPSARELKIAIVKNCIACHILTKGFEHNYLTKFGDFTKNGVLEKYSGAGSVNNSLLHARVASKEMPPAPMKDEERKKLLLTISNWISDGYPSLDQQNNFNLVDYDTVIRSINADLKKQTDPNNVRYISLVNIANDPKKRIVVGKIREGLFKLLNSLSWNEKNIIPEAIDSSKLVYRIKLSNYSWDNSTWKTIERNYPYKLEFITGNPSGLRNFEILVDISKTNLPIIRADWMIANLSVPPLYNEILRLPQYAYELEKKLGIDVGYNIKNAKIIRAAFNQSKISKHNRIIERHPTKFANGYYWKTYDFNTSVEEQDVLKNPIGPETVFAGAFKHDSNEILFSLPNGNQAYFISNNKGKRLDASPANIVSDPEQPDSTVISGLSCIRCHSEGLIPQKDSLSTSSSLKFQKVSDIEYLKKIYNNDKLNSAFLEDMKNFATAQKTMGITSPEPTKIANSAYHDFVLRDSAFNELFLKAKDLREIQSLATKEKNSNFQKLAQALASFESGSKREEFEGVYDNLKRILIEQYFRLTTSLEIINKPEKSTVLPKIIAAETTQMQPKPAQSKCAKANDDMLFSLGEILYISIDGKRPRKAKIVQVYDYHPQYRIMYENGEESYPSINYFFKIGCYEKIDTGVPIYGSSAGKFVGYNSIDNKILILLDDGTFEFREL